MVTVKSEDIQVVGVRITGAVHFALRGRTRTICNKWYRRTLPKMREFEEGDPDGPLCRVCLRIAQRMYRDEITITD